LIGGKWGRRWPTSSSLIPLIYLYKSMTWNLSVGFMRRFGSVITYLWFLNPEGIIYCGYLLASKAGAFVDKEKK
jgi:hypothetical protein